MQKIKRKYGWKPELPDHRDYIYKPKLAPAKLPTSVDLRPSCAAPYDQSTLGSCVSNAVAGAVEFIWQKCWKIETPSRLFIYYNGRVIENDVTQDNGLYVRDGIKSITQKGVCTEGVWPYDITQFATVPNAAAYKYAGLFLVNKEAITYESIDNSQINNLKDVLAAGHPFVFGFTVYESFESDAVAANGIVPMPSKHESVLGGHCVEVVGYDDSKNWFIIRNSWGTDWGAGGYGFMPYNYLTNTNLSSDFWVITKAGY